MYTRCFIPHEKMEPPDMGGVAFGSDFLIRSDLPGAPSNLRIVSGAATPKLFGDIAASRARHFGHGGLPASPTPEHHP